MMTPCAAPRVAPAAAPRLHRRITCCAASADGGPAPASVTRRELGAAVLAGSLAAALSPRQALAASAPADGAGALALVTGANTGIGYETALGLARAGYVPVLACRTVAKGKAAAARLADAVPGASAVVLDMPCELGDLRSVAAYADAVKTLNAPLHLLVNNAGIMAAPYGQTADGHELHFGVNHLGHFALTNALVPLLRAGGAGARIIHVSSIAAYGPGFDVADFEWTSRRYDRWGAYCASKRENVLFSDALAAREAAAGSGVASLALHPGIVDTELVRYLVPSSWLEARAAAGDRSAVAATAVHVLGLRTPPEGAAPTLWAATQRDAAPLSGGFYLDAAAPAPSFGRPGGGADGERLRELLWEQSARAVDDALAGGRAHVALAA